MHRPLPPNKPHHYIRHRSQLNPQRLADQTCSKNRKSIVEIKNEVSSGKLHMPAGLLAKIVSYLGEDGIGELKNWIVSGREGLKAVLSPECLSTEIPMREFHIPQPLMEIIVSKVGEDGVDALKNLLLAGREGKDAVLSKKTLASV
ncbi:hypothetical protein ISN45_Aa08g007890 [Arabidopsis thaliana x Arabidopsis arenosa]|uniref:Uncharacterized protein n=1 Tax=Arabidopsis thaliana x Arabidopsis arenosa TaxID=1240361 RepID=A0A8T1XF36_9BRAS|nr:hypothetical protein ISN45_Aa08g007890 [Arabidopsis thaliana x Arabidopsis arenosa]